MRKNFDIAAFCIHKNECWFFAREFNCLFYKNIDSGETEVCGAVPWEVERNDMLYKEMEYIDGKLYLIPFRARSIAVYDIEQKKYYKIELDSRIVDNKRNLFRAGLVYNKKIIAFGIHVPAIIIIDSTTGNVEYLTDWYENVKNYLVDKSKALFRKQLVVIDNKVYIPMVYGDIVLTVDLETKQISINHLNLKKTGYVGITNNGNKIYLVSRDGGGTIGCWDCTTKEKIIIGKLNQNGSEINKFLLYNLPYIDVLYEKNYGNMEEGELVRAIESNCDCLLSNGCETAFFCDDGKVLYFGNREKTKIDISVEITPKEKVKMRGLNVIIKENSWYGIEQFIKENIEE